MSNPSIDEILTRNNTNTNLVLVRPNPFSDVRLDRTFILTRPEENQAYLLSGCPPSGLNDPASVLSIIWPKDGDGSNLDRDYPRLKNRFHRYMASYPEDDALIRAIGSHTYHITETEDQRMSDARRLRYARKTGLDFLMKGNMNEAGVQIVRKTYEDLVDELSRKYGLEMRKLGDDKAIYYGEFYVDGEQKISKDYWHHQFNLTNYRKALQRTHYLHNKLDWHPKESKLITEAGASADPAGSGSSSLVRVAHGKSKARELIISDRSTDYPLEFREHWENVIARLDANAISYSPEHIKEKMNSLPEKHHEYADPLMSAIANCRDGRCSESERTEDLERLVKGVEETTKMYLAPASDNDEISELAKSTFKSYNQLRRDLSAKYGAFSGQGEVDTFLVKEDTLDPDTDEVADAISAWSMGS